MNTITRAYTGADIHDGVQLHKDHAVLRHANESISLRPADQLPEGCPIRALNGGLIAPGFVDLQVNGGGGVMFNDDPSVATLRTIAQAHATTGTAAILPTLITDTPARTRAAIDAVADALEQGVAGIIGLHLEGPHLSVARKGAHDAALIRKMDDDDLALLLGAADRLANVMVTVAPETTSNAQIKAMAQAGITVSLGHTDADAATCHAAFDAGARCVTHLFNAMSQLHSRTPGLVGATLERGDVFAGLIADAIHVHPATIRIALAAKPQSDRVFLVSDAMATAASGIKKFSLNGRDVFRNQGRLTLADGTLAGADLTLPRALAVMVNDVGDSAQNAIVRTTSTPASLLRDPLGFGHITTSAANVIYLAPEFQMPVALDTLR